MDGLFRELTAALDAQATQGVLLGGRPYPKIRVEKGLQKKTELFVDLETKTIRAVPV